MHFYCSSILIVYDGALSTQHKIPNNNIKEVFDSNSNKSNQANVQLDSIINDVKVCMIDFAHTLPSDGDVDHGYIYGLRNLLSMLYQIAV